MAAIKSVNRSASVALAPDSPYMAAGTMAGAVDLSFSSSACLEVFKLDFQSEDHDLPVVGECQSSERFNRLAWGRNGSGSDTYGLGLIAGGLVDGNIDIWNPLSLIRSEASENALVGHLSRHKGPVRGLEFNSIAPNLLASGADDGEICIWDLAAPLEPSHFPPLKGTGSASQGEISYVSWNCRVQHILASTSSNGITVVWDLKKQKPAISFGDSIRRRCSVLQWHPDVATQLVVASDEDGSPSLRLWDMRNIIEPVKEFVGHTKGVIGMSWCPNDSSYLLTCAKDNRTICWNTVTAEIVCELPAGTNWNFDVHWYPWMPGVISASSFDGKIGIYNIEGCSRYTAGDNDFGRAKLRAPKWCERPVGASFGFGGKLVSFCPKLPAAGASQVFLHNLVTEDKSESVDDRETWGFLKVMFEEDGTARTRMLAHLGFSVPIEEKDAEQENGLNQQINAIRLDDTPTDKEGYENNKEATIFSADDGEDFFNNLPSPKADASLAPSGDNLDLGNSAPIVEEISQEPETLEESADPSFDDSIQRALVLGDYKGAVAQCISANKIADALVIAHAGGTSLWENTRDQYLKLSPSPYLKIVAAMVNNDLLTLVNTRPLKYWKETLALLCTFAPSEEWSMLCNSLASKLMAAGNTLAATLCYICAGNIDKTVEIWSTSLSAEREGKSYIDLLQDLMEKTIVLALANGQKQFSASFCKLVEKYAEILASQGLLTTALEYLKLLGSDDLSPELTIIRDRIALSMKPEKEAKTPAFDNTQQQGGTFYGAKNPGFGVADASHPYYQGAAAQQMHQSVAEGSYTENYQQPIDSSYGRGFGAPASFQPSPPPAYQPAPPPQMFIPTPTPQAPHTNFTPLPPHAASQQPTRPFVPANVPMLRNAEQYQQPTLGSQLYPGTANPAYNTVQPPTGSQGPITAQVGTIPGHRMPQVVAPGPTPNGFRPVHSGVAQRPGIGSMQPPNTTQPASLQAAVVPAAPPPTVQTVDTSNVPAHHRPVITTLTRLFKETSEALGGARANPARKREIEDNSRKIGALFAKLNSGDISENASDKLFKLCQALDINDFSTALQIQVLLTTSEWDECNFWLATLKRMIKTRQGAAGCLLQCTQKRLRETEQQGFVSLPKFTITGSQQY
ncbi:WD40/YVTN REPEAT-LIKE-CONTAINING DOMAIN ANCESTRAL COATOMER ELEMENT 1 SEC16/SEC31-RELATED [Salix koriyanagi]|uniref:WD40/YVTN REPEAT-LIKE-CONTAINING DOMAIN ANCESTRAL COATOMER ELEMENT 1 SEC16/SEC31-RELATED n=1 Tax=Salix koriyanagi TaxID=2511006 RepID=A0A9Q0X2I1_9ROSI|nr:WD40/YVTN REPEAT-LIKE-CONTAINING DOMAIN ANCESTRAL COATOMER ELEMENT 1 SEC16/SEC31-RELATED [Salix koriyanagi]